MPLSSFSVPLSKLMCCQCLLKQTRISTFQLSSGSHVFLKQIQTKRSLVTWLITLLLIICPSSYKARPDNLIGLNSFCSEIISPQRSSARPTFPTSNAVGGAKFVWHPGYKKNLNSKMALRHIVEHYLQCP